MTKTERAAQTAWKKARDEAFDAGRWYVPVCYWPVHVRAA